MTTLIGITCYREPASWGAWRDVPAVLVPAGYVDKVVEAGGTPLLIAPKADRSEGEAAAILDRLDGLILAGGVDVEPGRYGEDPHPEVQTSRADRDDSELLFARLAQQRDLPLLGICRGMQVMAVAAGGSLDQHLPDRLGHGAHSPAPATYGDHAIHVNADTLLSSILGEWVDSVPSYHHQGVASCPGYTFTAFAPDGTPEAMEDTGGRFRLGVQWHPEAGDDPRLFAALVAAASARG